jgi:hypothetical protein
MLRRITVFLVVGALLLTTFPAIALAAEITCGTSSDRSAHPVICQGTNNSDQIRERKGTKQDDIRARDGNDTINARRAGSDADSVYAQPGDDTIRANDGDTRDKIDCGQGTDTATIDVKRNTSGTITAADQVSSDCETIKDQNGATIAPGDLPTTAVVDMADNPS